MPSKLNLVCYMFSLLKTLKDNNPPTPTWLFPNNMKLGKTISNIRAKRHICPLRNILMTRGYIVNARAKNQSYQSFLSALLSLVFTCPSSTRWERAGFEWNMSEDDI